MYFDAFCEKINSSENFQIYSLFSYIRYSDGEPIVPYGPKAATDTNIEVKKQTTTPAVGGTTSWAGGALTNIRYAINFEVVPSK